MKLPKFVINWLLKVHESARATPYFHLPGYMNRDWILGFRSPERNENNPLWDLMDLTSRNWFYRFVCRHIAIRAHTILSSDKDRHLRDHPSWSLSIVLEGGYWEVCEPTETAVIFPGYYQANLDWAAKGDGESSGEWVCEDMADFGIHWRGPGSVILRSAKAAHRLILPPNTVTKSIFCMGKRSQEWGFYTESGKVFWKDYLGVK